MTFKDMSRGRKVDSTEKKTQLAQGPFVPQPGYMGFCQMCGKSATGFKVMANRAFFLCSKACEDRYGTLRAESIQLGQVNAMIDATGTGIAEQIRNRRQSAYDANSCCWYCGKTKKMGVDKCPACARQADVPVS